MRKLIAVLSALVLTGSVAQAETMGSSFGALMTAQSLAQGRAALGGRFGMANTNSFVGSLGYGFSNSADGRIKAGLVGNDLAGSELALGADAKWQILKVYDVAANGQPARTSNPFDLAMGPFFEWYKTDYRQGAYRGMNTVSQLGMQMVGSYPFLLNSGGSVAPYARVNARNEWVNVDADNGAGGTIQGTNSDVALGLNTGVAWRPRASAVSLYGEVQIDGNNGVFLGMDYRVR